MPYKDKLNYIQNEIRVLTGIDTEIICDDRQNIRFITDKKKSRRIDVSSINSVQELVLYSRLVSLDLTRPA